MNKKPNVIYILADDMGYGDVSFLNEHCGFCTQNLDEMCRNGVAFCDAHSTSAVCTPSRYGILTGRYNWRSRLKSSVIGGYSRHLIEEGRFTVADLFKRNGYFTAAVGKWHLGMDFPVKENFIERENYASSEDLDDGVDYDGKIAFSPVTNGFDSYFGISASLDMPPYVYIEDDHFTNKPDHYCRVERGKAWYRPGPAAPDFVHEEVLDVLTKKVISHMENHQKEPFFIYYPMPAPHGPILPGKEFLGKSGCNEYTDYVLRCDHAVGQIVDKLKELNLYDNTIVVFTADNGCSPIADYEELKKKGHNPSYIFRGTKADIYEGGHRIPLIVQWPDQMPKGQKCRETVCLCDFMATMADNWGIICSRTKGWTAFPISLCG